MAGLAKEYSQRGAHEKAIALAEATVRDHPSMVMGRWRWRNPTFTLADTKKAGSGWSG